MPRSLPLPTSERLIVTCIITRLVSEIVATNLGPHCDYRQTSSIFDLCIFHLFISFFFFFFSSAIKEIRLVTLNRKASLISNYRIITAGANVYLARINELSSFRAVKRVEM